MTTTTNNTAAKPVSKMSLARAIFTEIYAEGYKLPEGKQHRGHFIDRCVAELGLKDKAAATYHYNINGLVNKGKKLYAHSGKKKDAAPTQFVDVSAAFNTAPSSEDNVQSDVNAIVEEATKEVNDQPKASGPKRKAKKDVKETVSAE